MDQLSIEIALADLSIGALRYYPVIDSTNDEAARWADQGAPDTAIVIADEQTAGRGRAGRRWYTPPGAALAFSLVLYSHTRDAPGIQHLTALGALAVQTALKEYYALPAQIKWPNDVLVDRLKVAGVLAEAHWLGEHLNYFILGIGINIAPLSIAWASEEGTKLEVPVICLEDMTGNPVDRLEVLHHVLKELLVWRSSMGTANFINAWEAALAFRDEWVIIYQDAWSDPETKDAASPAPLKGKILGLDEDGGLLLRSSDGEILTLHSGDIRVRPVV